MRQAETGQTEYSGAERKRNQQVKTWQEVKEEEMEKTEEAQRKLKSRLEGYEKHKEGMKGKEEELRRYD